MKNGAQKFTCTVDSLMQQSIGHRTCKICKHSHRHLSTLFRPPSVSEDEAVLSLSLRVSSVRSTLAAALRKRFWRSPAAPPRWRVCSPPCPSPRAKCSCSTWPSVRVRPSDGEGLPPKNEQLFRGGIERGRM